MHMAATKTTLPAAALAILTSLVAPPQRTEAAGPRDGSIAKRAPWTSSRITGSPEPPLPYTTERVFPALTFNQCLDITTAPGSNRLFVVEQSGKIFSFPVRPDVQNSAAKSSQLDGLTTSIN